MRIAVAGFSHESNSFAQMPTQLEDFNIRQGQKLLDHFSDTFHEVAGYIAGAAAHDFEIHPILTANATPAGPVTAATYEDIVGRILAGLQAAPPLDGVLLELHGAMVSEKFPQADGETVRRVRQQMGPDFPIVVTHDYHANVPPVLVENADALIIYKTNPHIDQRERGLQAAGIIAAMARKQAKPAMALAKPELLFNIYFHNTSVAPMQPLMQAAIELEKEPGILACSIAAGYQYADVPYMGPSIVVITDGDPQRAQREADRLGALMWDIRKQLKPKVLDPAAAVQAAQDGDTFPVCLLDFGDNIGGGSSGDSTFVLEQLLTQKAEGWVFTVWDPEAVAACFSAGVGADVELMAGAHTDDQHGRSIKVKGRVRTLHDGTYEETERRHGGGRFFNQGPTAVVYAGKGLLVLNSRRTSPNSIHQITCLGIQPHQQRLLVAKGAVAPRAAYEPISARLIEVDSGGATAISRGPENYRLARKTLYEWQENE
jgi:microcystin degradation protein MlrC